MADRTYNGVTLQKLLDRTEAAIAEMEAQNEGGDDPPPPRLPEQLRRAEGLRVQVLAAMERLANEQGSVRVNLTDGDAHLMKGRHGIEAAQAFLSDLESDHDRVRALTVDIYLVLEQDKDVALAVPNDFRRRLILFGSIGLLAALLVAWVTTRRVVKPTEVLTAAAVRMAEGELADPIRVSAQRGKL